MDGEVRAPGDLPGEPIADELDQAALERIYAPLQQQVKARGLWATQLRTRAERDGNEYVISGHKCFSSSGSIADFLIVMGGRPRATAR